MAATLSVEEKAKGKRIITQFFRTMPGVQKNLMTLFEKDGFQGVYRLQGILYPDNATEIDSIDTLRKGLSMILQHIYGMPVEDKEGYFQEITKCKTANQVIRKEKETLVNYFYDEHAELKDFLREAMVGDRNFRLMNVLCKRFLGEEEDEVTDMRSFKNQIRNIREVLSEEISSGTTEEELIGIIKEKQEEVASAPEPEPAPAEAPVADAAPAPTSDDQAEEKKRIITSTLGDDKYTALRTVLLNTAIIDPNFSTFQVYLDNILTPASRLIANNMETFSQGVAKIKEFRDTLEKELSS
jgi:hypothetical protein